MATNYKRVGCITGNPLCGLNRRMCIEVKQVYDACERRVNNLPATLTFEGFTAGTPVTIVNITNCQQATVSDTVVVTGDNCSQTSFNVSVPLVLSYIDDTGAAGTARSVLKYKRNVALKFPDSSLSPAHVEASVIINSDLGTHIGSGNVSFAYCIREVIKVVLTADIIIPTYGYAVYPECSECGGQCEGIMVESLFPN